MLDYAQAESRIARLAALEREALDLLVERDDLLCEMTELHSSCVLRLAPSCSMDSELIARVYKELRAGSDPPYLELYARDRALQVRQRALNVEMDNIRWELVLKFTHWAETAFPMNGILSMFNFKKDIT